ncbi:hypothetical protein Lal_00038431 [Lupinus albus]|nr:hypothetical protein Lal_00038431 [Lupinus albus]
MTSTLGINGFLRVSKCKFAKEIWDTLETNHEVLENMRFTNLTNHLISLDLYNSDLNLKVRRSTNI